MVSRTAAVATESHPKEPVAELGHARLAASGYRAMRSVFCEFRQGILTLRGRLPSFFYKQMAQETVAGLNGVKQVVNQIEVAGNG